MTDIIDTMAEAICKASYNGTNVLAVKELRDHYRKLAEAAVEAMSLEDVSGAPGWKWECPLCDTHFTAAEHGPLDIKWVRDQ